MKAIQYSKSIPRFLLVRSLGGLVPRFTTGRLSCIRLAEVPVPRPPGPRWLVVKTLFSGICGSDIATIAARGSPYFSPLISFPFILGHEVVGEIAQTGLKEDGFEIGEKVCIEPALCCPVREVEPFCRQCARGHFGNCENVTSGSLSPGLQTGYCRDTGGGWSAYLVAHPFQIHRLGQGLAWEEEVLVEPFSCALHAALAARVEESERALILGCGTVGLLTLAALRLISPLSRVTVVAKHPHQKRLAKYLGADQIIQLDRALYGSVARHYGAREYRPELGKPVLMGGADVTFDCVGSASSIDDALRFTRARGRVMVVGMPSIPRSVDWTSIWYKELSVQGAYTYGTEDYEGLRLRTFELALELLQQIGGRLKGIVGRSFGLEDYRSALHSAMHTGASGSAKVVFDLSGNTGTKGSRA